MRRMTVDAIVSEDVVGGGTLNLLKKNIPVEDSLSNGDTPAISRQKGINWLMLIYFASGVCSLMASFS